MGDLTVPELRVVARTLQNRPRVSSMEDAEFRAAVLQLIQDTRRTFAKEKMASGLLAQASSYASSEHFELALAAIQALLKNH